MCKKFSNSLQPVCIIRKQKFKDNIVSRTLNVRINKSFQYIALGFLANKGQCNNMCETVSFVPEAQECFLSIQGMVLSLPAFSAAGNELYLVYKIKHLYLGVCIMIQ